MMQRCTPKDTPCVRHRPVRQCRSHPRNPCIPCISNRSRPRHHASRSTAPMREALLQGRAEGPGGESEARGIGVLRAPARYGKCIQGCGPPRALAPPLAPPRWGPRRKAGVAGVSRGWSGGGAGGAGPNPTESPHPAASGMPSPPRSTCRHRPVRSSGSGAVSLGLLLG
jgi:hypothetical protein